MRIVLIIVAVFVSGMVQGEINTNLQERLLAMEISDQKIRKKITEYGSDQIPKEFLETVKQIDSNNTDELKKIVIEHGWPTKKLVGSKGVSAAFLIVQHSSDIEFKFSLLPSLKASYRNGEGISGQQIALFTDKILTTKGKKQIYGTQFDVKKSEIIFRPIENEKTVDGLRAELKLPPLGYYKKVLEELYGIKDHPDIEMN